MADMGVLIFAAVYITFAVGAMVYLTYTWHKDRKRKRRPKLKLVRGNRKDG